MNNKGFAITGIIYTLFILFLMILISILSGIRVMQRSASDSVYKLKEKVEKVNKKEGDLNSLIDNEKGLILPEGTGKYYKYEFKIDGKFKDESSGIEQQIKVKCSTYISKDTKLEDVVFSPRDCNEYSSIKDAIINSEGGNAELIGVYEFNGW